MTTTSQRKGAAGERACVTFLRTVCNAEVYQTGAPGVAKGQRGHRGTMRTPGIADLAVFLPWSNLFFFWEVKTGPRAQLSKPQRAFRDHCLATGTLFGSGDREALQAFLVEHGAMAMTPSGALRRLAWEGYER